MKTFETTITIVKIGDDERCYIYLPSMRDAAHGYKAHSELIFGDMDNQAVRVDLDALGRVVGVELVGFTIQAGT